MNNFAACSLRHIHREQNMVADCLAKHSLTQDIGLWGSPSVPDFAVTALLDDITLLL